MNSSDSGSESKVTRSSTFWRLSLGLGGVLECGIALYHAMLPYHMEWSRGLGGIPDSLVWAIFALNFSWSVVVFLAGCLVLYAAGLGPAAGRFAKVTIFVVGLFWLIHGLYTWLNPLPLPPSLAWLRAVLGGFPVVVVALHWLPLAAYRRHGA
jgi:hypothetical protein